MGSFLGRILLLVLLFGLGSCGGGGLVTSGTLSVELVGGGGGQIAAPGIDCPGTCETEIEFTQAQVSTTFSSQKKTDVKIQVDASSELLWWLVDSIDAISATPAANCGSNKNCSVITKSICGASMVPPVCAANAISNVALRALVVEKNSLVDWEQGGGDACVIRKSGAIQCWESTAERYRDFERTAPPAVVNPTDISVFNDYACVRDQSGVHCWGDYAVVREPAAEFGLQDIISFEVVNGAGCALDANGVTCWAASVNASYAGLLEVPQLSAPVNMRREGDQVCVDDDAEKVCWFWGSLVSSPITTRTALQPTQ